MPVRSDQEIPVLRNPRRSPSIAGALRALASTRSRATTPRPESESELRERREEHVILLSSPEVAEIIARHTAPVEDLSEIEKDSCALSPGLGTAATPDVEDISITVEADPSKQYVEFSGLVGRRWPRWIQESAKGQLDRFDADLTMLLAVSGLVITLAFASVLQPPGGTKTSADAEPRDVKVGAANLSTGSSSFQLFFGANGSAMAAASLAVVLLITFPPRNNVQALFINVVGRTLVWVAVQSSLLAFCAAVYIISGRKENQVLPFWIASGFLYILFTAMFAFRRVGSGIRRAKRDLQAKVKVRKSRIRTKARRP